MRAEPLAARTAQSGMDRSIYEFFCATCWLLSFSENFEMPRASRAHAELRHEVSAMHRTRHGEGVEDTGSNLQPAVRAERSGRRTGKIRRYARAVSRAMRARRQSIGQSLAGHFDS